MPAANAPGSTAPSPPSSSVPTAVADAQSAGTPVDPAIVAADNAFGLKLLDTLLPGSGGNNIAVSPLSAALALQILYNDAAGSTQQAMAQALQLSALSVPTLNTDNAALQASLINPDPKVQLTIANSLWLDQTNSPVVVNVVQHQTVVEVDETGTMAAAATGGGEIAAVPQTFIMIMNHPFLYAIQDDKTGQLLFVGVLMNPTG